MNLSATGAEIAEVIDQFLTGKRALVTASSRNLGASIAITLASHGASVCVQFHDSENAAVSLIDGMDRSAGQRHAAVHGDMGDADSIRQLVVEATNRLGGDIDILVNNSGPFSMTPYADLPEADWDHVWNSNAKACYVAAQCVAAGMRSGGWGRIINISAGSAYLRNHSIYGLAKQAMIFLTEEMALELGPAVTVNAIAPGQIEESAADIGDIDPTFVARAIDRTPAGRLVTRAEVAELIALLCSPACDMVTGATIPVDGGWRLNRF